MFSRQNLNSVFDFVNKEHISFIYNKYLYQQPSSLVAQPWDPVNSFQLCKKLQENRKTALSNYHQSISSKASLCSLSTSMFPKNLKSLRPCLKLDGRQQFPNLQESLKCPAEFHDALLRTAGNMRQSACVRDSFCKRREFQCSGFHQRTFFLDVHGA